MQTILTVFNITVLWIPAYNACLLLVPNSDRKLRMSKISYDVATDEHLLPF